MKAQGVYYGRGQRRVWYGWRWQGNVTSNSHDSLTSWRFLLTSKKISRTVWHDNIFTWASNIFHLNSDSFKVALFQSFSGFIFGFCISTFKCQHALIVVIVLKYFIYYWVTINIMWKYISWFIVCSKSTKYNICLQNVV